MEGELPGSSRFDVVFARNTGSRKQRAKREGRLSVSYHISSLYDTDAKACVMVCKGTGVMPNRIYSQMQAARRGAAWTVGTQLVVNGFEVVIEAVIELHLIPYSESVDREAAALDNIVATLRPTEVDAANGDLPFVASTACSLRRGGTGAGPGLPGESDVMIAALSSAAPPLSPLRTSPFGASALLPLKVTKCESAAAPRSAATGCGRPCENSPPRFHCTDDGLPTLSSRRKAQGAEGTAEAAADSKRVRTAEDHVTTKAQGPPSSRVRRSAASVARELRSVYPQYF
jgi:hypothetical protein